MKRSSCSTGRILVISDQPEALACTKQLLEGANYRVDTASGCDEATQRLENGEPADLVILEMASPKVDGLKTIEACRRICTEQKILVISEDNDATIVVQAIRLGALDYITKPRDKSVLVAEVRLLLGTVEPQNEDGAAPQARVEFEEIEHDVFFLAASAAMQKIRAQVMQVAKVDIPVLLLGESGSGKEVIARLIHKESRRVGKPLVKVNCAALPHDLLESELFGYDAGAFTGANRPKPGMLELCNKGTIFLDEIGEMSPVLQAKLLHVLQDGKFSRLGSRSSTTSDFRVLAATNINVKEAIDAKTFRGDLYYRLNAFTINIPPLRERREEVPLLMRHFMRQFSEKYDCPPANCSNQLIRACMRYSWPGNLRELGNFVKRYMVLQDEGLAIAELEDQARVECSTAGADVDADAGMITGGLKSMVQDLKEKAEPKIIERVLVATKWNCKVAAMQLKISYKALLYKMKQYRIFPPGVTGTRLAQRHS